MERLLYMMTRAESRGVITHEMLSRMMILEVWYIQISYVNKLT